MKFHSDFNTSSRDEGQGLKDNHLSKTAPATRACAEFGMVDKNWKICSYSLIWESQTL
jgi:hypothetical protein